MNFRTNDIFKNVLSKDPNYISLSEKDLNMLKSTLIEMLDDIKSVCEENGLRYSLSGGTLLGAVRHKGFIPWDDDADLDMPREDFYKFAEKFKEKYKDKYWLHIPGKTDDYGVIMARVRKKGTVYREAGDIYNSESGIFIDIFLVENTYTNKFLRLIHEVLCTVGLGMISCRNFYKNRKLFLSLTGNNTKAALLFRFKTLLGFLISWLPVRYVAKLAFSVFGMCKNGNSKLVVIPGGRKKFKGETFLRKDYCEYIKADFEGHQFNIPVGYDRILKQLYGNYMKIPPEDKREKHVVLEFKV